MSQDEKQEYTIKIIPKHGDEIKNIRISATTLKAAIGTVAVAAVLLVGTLSYSVYSTFTAHNNASEIQELRKVNGIQQEQLLQLSKKANSLQDQLDQLTKLENDLRRMSGAGPADSSVTTGTSGDDANHDGQGGPYVAPDLDNIGATLNNIEQGIEQRRQSLLALQEELKARQEAMGVPASAAGVAGFNANPYGVMGSSLMPSIWATRGVVSSPYGMRWNGSDFHPGIDIANDMGTPIVATADGTVTTAGWNSGGYGNMVDIDHGNGIMTRYGHAMQVVVSAGQHVRRGQVIAYMGSTGFSTGPHVHYEVRINGQAVNPMSYL